MDFTTMGDIKMGTVLSGRAAGLIALLLLAAVGFTSPRAEEPRWQYRFEPAAGITSAGQPREAGLIELAEQGYAAVIDLRAEGEDRGLDERRVVEALGMHYVSLPIPDGDAVNFDNARQLDLYIAEQGGPVLVHCGSGNRAGALLALRQKLKGASDEEALAFGRAAGMTRLEDTVRTRLASD